MKTLFLIRHAKSSWEEEGLPDFDRPLNERGKKDVPGMAEKLLKHSLPPQLIITSTAKRARKTAQLFAKEWGFAEEQLLGKPDLYLCGPLTFEDLIAQAPDKADRLAVVAHNPGITEYANLLCEKVRIDNMPTCSIFAVSADCTTWKDFAHAKKTFLFFEHPKASQ